METQVGQIATKLSNLSEAGVLGTALNNSINGTCKLVMVTKSYVEEEEYRKGGEDTIERGGLKSTAAKS